MNVLHELHEEQKIQDFCMILGWVESIVAPTGDLDTLCLLSMAIIIQTAEEKWQVLPST